MTRARPSQMTTRPAPIPRAPAPRAEKARDRPRRVSGGPVTPLTAQVAAECARARARALQGRARRNRAKPKPKAKARRETESAEPRGTRDESIGDASVGGGTPTRERPDPGRSLDAAVGSSEPNAADAAARRAEEVIQAAERRVRAARARARVGAPPGRRAPDPGGEGCGAFVGRRASSRGTAKTRRSTLDVPGARASGLLARADRTAQEAAATPAYPVATPAPTPRARLVPNPGAFLEPKLADAEV